MNDVRQQLGKKELHDALRTGYLFETKHRARIVDNVPPAKKAADDGNANLRSNWAEDKTWQPDMEESVGAAGIKGWHKAIQRALEGVE